MPLAKAIVHGNLTRDPEVRFTTKGTAICNFTVAVNRKWKNEAGEMKEEATFIDLSAFGKTAESIGQFFKKGKQILVEGRLVTQQWTDKQSGQQRSKLAVTVEAFHFVGDNQGAPRTESRPAPAPAPASPPSEDDTHDEVPF